MSCNNDPNDIIGMKDFINENEIKSTIDLKEIENNILNGESYIDNVKLFENEYFSSFKQVLDKNSVISESIHQESLNEETPNIENEYCKYNERTNEEKTSAAIKNFISSEETENDDFNLGGERLSDDKLTKLEEIENLESQLNLKKEELNNYSVNKDDDYNTIKNIWERLRHKSELEQYDHLLTQAIEFTAGIVEKVFDGKKQYFGYSPDMTDWSSSIKLKLKRMAPQKTKVVSDMVRNYKLNDSTHIILQLALSGILYSQTRIRYNENETTEKEYMDAIIDIDDD